MKNADAPWLSTYACLHRNIPADDLLWSSSIAHSGLLVTVIGWVHVSLFPSYSVTSNKELVKLDIQWWWCQMSLFCNVMIISGATVMCYSAGRICTYMDSIYYGEKLVCISWTVLGIYIYIYIYIYILVFLFALIWSIIWIVPAAVFRRSRTLTYMERE